MLALCKRDEPAHPERCKQDVPAILYLFNTTKFLIYLQKLLTKIG